MVSLKKYWSALQNFVVSNSEQRKTLLDLSQAFTTAAHNLKPDDIFRPPSNDNNQELYSIYACSKNLDLAGSTHTFLRLVNPNGDIECDIHGVKQPRDAEGRTPLSAIIEPKEFEHFDHLSDNQAALLWKGTAQQAGEKMRLAMALVERVNETKPSYKLFSRNCNTLLNSLANVMDLKMPQMPNWAPGISNLLSPEIEHVKRDAQAQGQDKPNADEHWLILFVDKLEDKRQSIIRTFGSLASAGAATKLQAGI